jgi:hypothetical protein
VQAQVLPGNLEGQELAGRVMEQRLELARDLEAERARVGRLLDHVGDAQGVEAVLGVGGGHRARA